MTCTRRHIWDNRYRRRIFNTSRFRRFRFILLCHRHDWSWQSKFLGLGCCSLLETLCSITCISCLFPGCSSLLLSCCRVLFLTLNCFLTGRLLWTGQRGSSVLCSSRPRRQLDATTMVTEPAPIPHAAVCIHRAQITGPCAVSTRAQMRGVQPCLLSGCYSCRFRQ